MHVAIIFIFLLCPFHLAGSLISMQDRLLRL